MPDARGDGYVDDIPYTHGYHAAMNPRVMQWTLAQAGYRPPEVRSACELGFGQGVSLAIHGSVGAVAWQGTDFNPDHAHNARALCEGCEPRPRIYAESFAEYFARRDLPAFDFIALHAVWSWVSPENRARLVEFIRQRLRPGGALYLSYNCLPGWQPMLALREQLVERAAAAQREGLPLAEAIRRAVVELERLEHSTGCNLRRTRHRPRWKQGGERIPKIPPLGKLAAHRGSHLRDAAVLLHLPKSLDAHAAGCANSSEIIAQQIDDHHVLGPILRGLGELTHRRNTLPIGRPNESARSLHGPRSHRPPPQTEETLGTERGDFQAWNAAPRGMIDRMTGNQRGECVCEI